MRLRIQYNQGVGKPKPLSGVFAAAVTPLKADYSPAVEDVRLLLEHLASRGCHGALLLGTTGEGPSFAYSERRAIFEAAGQFRQQHPDFRLLAGTGTPSLEETIQMTQAAFENGFDGVVVLPPYFFRSASEDGLFTWYSEVIRKAVPESGVLLGYHIPPVSGVPLSMDLLARLLQAFPGRFAGIKDSSGDPDHTRRLGEHFGEDLLVLNGNDKLFSLALQAKAAGCITAMANLYSPLLRQLWDAYQQGETTESLQDELTKARQVLDRYPPAAPTLKALLALRGQLPLWPVRPPLLPASDQTVTNAAFELGLDRP